MAMEQSDRALRLEDLPKVCRLWGADGCHDDPFGQDAEDDVAVSVTRRGLARIVLVASEVGASFDRSGAALDPLAWMLAPRTMFDGAAAIDACQELGNCLRGVLMHQLDAGPDADLETLDAILDGDGDGDGDWEGGPGSPLGEGIACISDATSPDAADLRLYSCRATTEDGGIRTWAFDALIAVSFDAARRAFAARHGTAMAAAACIVEGFDRNEPHAQALVSPTLADAIEIASHDPYGLIARGLEVSIRQRLLA